MYLLGVNSFLFVKQLRILDGKQYCKWKGTQDIFDDTQKSIKAT